MFALFPVFPPILHLSFCIYALYLFYTQLIMPATLNYETNANTFLLYHPLLVAEALVTDCATQIPLCDRLHNWALARYFLSIMSDH